MAKQKKKKHIKPMPRAVRKRISDSLKRYYRKKHLEEIRLARKRSAAATKGWATRKKQQAKKEQTALKRQKKATCKVLFDGPDSDPPIEHFWSNLKELEGKSLNAKLLRLPATDGIVKTTFKIIDADVLHQPEEGAEELAEGDEFIEEWDTELDPDGFWATWFDHARESLPVTPEKKSDGTKSLLVLKLEVCFVPGQVSSD